MQEGARLIITVDCGANSSEAIKAARLAGADVVILDHHQMSEVHQEAVALVNPNRPDDFSGQGHLCAAGVVFVTLAWVHHLLRKNNLKDRCLIFSVCLILLPWQPYVMLFHYRG